MKRTGLLVLTVAAMVVGLAACSDKTEGIPGAGGNTGISAPSNTPSGGPFTGTKSSPTTGATTGRGGDNRLTGLAPCSLLTAAEVTELRAGDGKEDISTASRACVFARGEGFALTIAVRPELGLKDIDPSGGVVKPGTIGKHESAQFTGGISSCAYAIKVSETSRVDVSSSARGDEQKACQLANRAAEYVEQKLP